MLLVVDEKRTGHWYQWYELKQQFSSAVGKFHQQSNLQKFCSRFGFALMYIIFQGGDLMFKSMFSFGGSVGIGSTWSVSTIKIKFQSSSPLSHISSILMLHFTVTT